MKEMHSSKTTATHGNPSAPDGSESAVSANVIPFDRLAQAALLAQKPPWVLASEKESCRLIPDSCGGDKVLWISAVDASGDRLRRAAAILPHKHSAALEFAALGDRSGTIMFVDRLEMLAMCEADPKWMVRLDVLRDPPTDSFIIVFESRTHREIFVGRR